MDEACLQTDLSGADLSGLDCAGLDRPGANLSPAVGPPEVPTRLVGTDLSQSTLSGANLASVEAAGVNLTLAYLEGATALCAPDACPATFDSAILEFASLQQVDFSGSSFRFANLQDANLAWATLNGADLTGADLGFSWMPGVRMAGAALSSAQLEYVESGCVASPSSALGDESWCPDFSGADLQGADLTRVNITGALMTGTDLREAVLSLATLDDLDTPCTEPVEEGAGFACLQISSLLSPVATDMSDLRSRNADWAGVDLRNASARGASFNGTFFYKVRTIQPEAGEAFDQVYLSQLSEADLAGGNLGAADLTSVDLSRALLTDVIFTQALLFGAELAGADVTGALFDQADLGGVHMDSATELLGADFSSATLRGADLRSVDFKNAEFAIGAVIEEDVCVLAPGGVAVDLVGAQLSEADFSAAPHFFQGCITVDATTTYSELTRFPEGFNLESEMTIQVPEPLQMVLQGAALAGLGFLRWGQKRMTRPRREDGA